MKKAIKNILVIALVTLVTLVGATSCKSSGKMSKKEYKARVEQAKTDLTAIIDGTTEWSCDEQQARLDMIKEVDFSKKNPEVVDMIDRAQAAVTACKKEVARVAEEQRIAEEQRLREMEEMNKPKTSIDEYLNRIASARDVNAANSLIREALGLFSSPDVPVLILINKYGDYDRPTTAEQYLNYVKDQKKAGAKVNNVKMENGKITELELIIKK